MAPGRKTLSVFAAVAVMTLVPVGTSSADPGFSVEDLTGPLSAEDLAERITGGAVTNVRTQGPATALGSFSHGGDVVGIPQGVVLSTGLVSDVPGPNDDPLITHNNESGEDIDLEDLPGYAKQTKDATVLEFDFTPASSPYSLDLVFSSDEYVAPGDTGRNATPFEDVAAVFVDGENCALAATDIVTTDTVGPSSHADLFVDNRDGRLDTEMDGLTTVLTCEKSVTVGETTHVKVAIADGTDHKGDANLFLETVETSDTDLAVTKTDTPDPVTAEGFVQYLVEVENNGPAAASGVTIDESVTNGTIDSMSGTGWTCSLLDALCTLGHPLSVGSAVTLEVIVEAGSEGTITNTATASHDHPDPVPGNDVAEETTDILAGGTEDQAITFCPAGGCSFDTGDDPDQNDPTVNEVVVPAGGDGSVTTLTEGITTFPCGGSKAGDDSNGQETNFVPPTGLTDPTDPIVVTTTWDPSVWAVHRGSDPGRSNGTKALGQVKICMQKVSESDGTTTVTTFRLEWCVTPGVADPDPCINAVSRDAENDIGVEILMTSEDPRWAR